jgi:hypothetical protein
MNEPAQPILESQRGLRKRLAVPPFAERLKWPERLRDGSVAVAANPRKNNFIFAIHFV